MARILIIDDQDWRHDGFRTAYKDKGHELHHVWNYHQAIKMLSKQNYDVVWLDHDLGENRTGLDIARFLSKVDTKPSLVICHSANYTGSRDIVFTCKDLGITSYCFDFLNVVDGYIHE